MMSCFRWKRLLFPLFAGLTFAVTFASKCSGQVAPPTVTPAVVRPLVVKKISDVWVDRATPLETPAELNPVGAMHIPIGIPNRLDSLKTFVEAEGGFSPGIGSFGVSFWVYDSTVNRLWSPTMEDVSHTHGLSDGRALIPWSEWTAGAVGVHTEVCEVERMTGEATNDLVGARATLSNSTDQTRQVALYVALRPLGPAGNAVADIAVSDNGDALLIEGHTALMANSMPSAAGVSAADTIGHLATKGEMPTARRATSPDGNCSGALRFDLSIPAGKDQTVGIVCPVHAGRRAVRHKWVARAKNFVDEATPKSDADGIDQPDLGIEHYRKVRADDLFAEATAYWDKFYAGSSIHVPDSRWSLGFDVMLAHAGLCMNEGAADVAVTNYTVFNRDGMYIANMMQKAGLPKLSEEIIDFFLQSPFNGRPFPEADNPGQILWSMGQHWQLTRDEAWLRRVYPAAKKLGHMIEYYRTTEGPHWVSLNSLGFGDVLPESKRMLLKPGSCDGHHPEYTEAFDIAGLRVMADFATARGESSDAKAWRELTDRLFADYDERFGKELQKGYGGYCVLWPCRLYSGNCGPAHEQCKDIGKQNLSTWRYFAPATAHQGLLAGNRQAGYATVNAHLDHPQMKNWFAFDEGGKSGSGGWQHLRTTWTHSKTQPDQNHAVAMPHGWAIAEVWLLMRDCLVTESGGYLKLLAGVSPQWFTDPAGMRIEDLSTAFGRCSFRYAPTDRGAVLTLMGNASPPSGFIICLPSELIAEATCGGKPAQVTKDGHCLVSGDTRRVALTFSKSVH